VRFSSIKNKLGNKYFDGGVVNPLDIFQRDLSNQELPQVFEQQVQPPMAPPAAPPMVAPAPAAPANPLEQLLNQPYEGQDFSDADIQAATAESARLAEESGVEDLTDQFGKTEDVLPKKEFKMPSIPKPEKKEELPATNFQSFRVDDNMLQGRDVMAERRRALNQMLGR
jgi:hypothetical protein